MNAAGATEPVVYILHDNDEWLAPFEAEFARQGVPMRALTLEGGGFDLAEVPPAGVFWSRLSASAHTRGRAGSKEVARATLRWLAAHGRRVVNGAAVVELEVSKVAQYLALAAAGFDVPRTIAVFGRDALVERAAELSAPFITKHNQGGKGLGVQRFDSHEAFAEYVNGPDYVESADGITLLQEYLVAAEPFITRVEFVAGKFVYAVRVDTSAGSFELCPAEACAVPQLAGAAADAAGESAFATGVGSIQLPEFVAAGAACDTGSTGLFTIREGITADDPLIRQLEGFLAQQGIEVAGVEFMETADGRRVVYDINTNTNYNPEAEAEAAVSAAATLVRTLGAELDAVRAQELTTQGR